MSFSSKIRLFSECFKLAGTGGLIACAKYLTGTLQLTDLTSESSILMGGVTDA